MNNTTDTTWDVIVVGAGTAGLPAAIFAPERGASVLVLDAAPEIGGTLHLSSGQMSAAGTRRQNQQNIDDTPDMHFEDIMRISKGTVDPDLVRLAVDNAAETLDWLEEIGFEPLPDHPVKGQAHEPYSEKRYVWGPELGKSILAVLKPRFEEVMAEGNITLKLNTRVTGLTQADDGTVTGVTAITDGGAETAYAAPAVLLAAGGYVANGVMYKTLHGHPAYGNHSYPYCVGDGLNLGAGAGGVPHGHENYLTGFGVVMESYDVPSKVYARQIHWPDKRMPWEIYINAHGQRFIREDEPSVDVREHSILDQPDLRHWIVFDEAILNAAPPLLTDWTAEDIRTAARNGTPMFYVADTLDALAEKAGLPATALAETIAAYNAAQASGSDSLGRAHMPQPIAEAPFYAIRSQAMGVSSTVGLKADTSLRVVRDDGTPIPGLYAAGEVLGGGALMGSSFCGGMMVTPAITFGRMLGQHLLPLGERARAAAE